MQCDGRNPYFTRFCCAIIKAMQEIENEVLSRNPYFTRFCCAIFYGGLKHAIKRSRNPYFTRFCCAIKSERNLLWRLKKSQSLFY